MSEKVRIRFSKAGAARFLSHHDLIRAFERMLRRADLPFKSSEGFHPKPKMAFASALGLGIVGREEVIEIEFDKVLPPETIRDRLAAQTLPGLGIQLVTPIPTKTVGQPIRATYFLPRLSLGENTGRPDCCPASHLGPDAADDALATHEFGTSVAALNRLITQVLQATELWVERERPRKKRLNLRPYLLQLALQSEGLTMTLAITAQGAARPEEVLGILGLGDLLANGAILERTRLELADELAAACPELRLAGQEAEARALTSSSNQRLTTSD